MKYSVWLKTLVLGTAISTLSLVAMEANNPEASDCQENSQKLLRTDEPSAAASGSSAGPEGTVYYYHNPLENVDELDDALDKSDGNFDIKQLLKGIDNLQERGYTVDILLQHEARKYCYDTVEELLNLEMAHPYIIDFAL